MFISENRIACECTFNYLAMHYLVNIITKYLMKITHEFIIILTLINDSIHGTSSTAFNSFAVIENKSTVPQN